MHTILLTIQFIVSAVVEQLMPDMMLFNKLPISNLLSIESTFR